MFFVTSALSVLALVASVGAQPRLGSRSVKSPLSHPQHKVGRLAARDISSRNWCGPILQSSNITSIEASWIVPSARIPEGGSEKEEYWAYQWVGIDGVHDCSVLLQGGTGQTIIDGTFDVFVWYEFYPAPPVLTTMNVRVGDEVFVRVDATSRTTGIIYVENRTTRESNTYKVSTDAGLLCLATAEWIVENPGDNVPFPAWDTYDFDGCKGSTSDGDAFNLKGAERWYMTQGGAQLCHSKVDSDTRVTFYNS